MERKEKIQKSIEIFKKELPDAKGKYRAYNSECKTNEVDIYSDDGLYCTVNVKIEKITSI